MPPSLRAEAAGAFLVAWIFTTLGPSCSTSLVKSGSNMPTLPPSVLASIDCTNSLPFSLASPKKLPNLSQPPSINADAVSKTRYLGVGFTEFPLKFLIGVWCGIVNENKGRRISPGRARPLESKGFTYFCGCFAGR